MSALLVSSQLVIAGTACRLALPRLPMKTTSKAEHLRCLQCTNCATYPPRLQQGGSHPTVHPRFSSHRSSELLSRAPLRMTRARLLLLQSWKGHLLHIHAFDLLYHTPPMFPGSRPGKLFIGQTYIAPYGVEHLTQSTPAKAELPYAAVALSLWHVILSL